MTDAEMRALALLADFEPETAQAAVVMPPVGSIPALVAEPPVEPAAELVVDPPIPALPDARFAKRKKVKWPANITHANLDQPLSVTVRDTSSTGARLELVESNGTYPVGASSLPKRFTLNIPVDRSAVDCETAWRTGPVMGVKYVSPTRALPKAPPPKEEQIENLGILQLIRNLEPL